MEPATATATLRDTCADAEPVSATAYPAVGLKPEPVRPEPKRRPTQP